MSIADVTICWRKVRGRLPLQRPPGFRERPTASAQAPPAPVLGGTGPTDRLGGHCPYPGCPGLPRPCAGSLVHPPRLHLLGAEPGLLPLVKHQVILDVLALASGYVLRVAAGVPLVYVERFSPWLYLCTLLLALFIGFAKRRQEIVLLGENASNHRAILEEYTVRFLDEMMGVVMAAIIVAYSLYTFSTPNLPSNHAMMLTIPFVVYGVFRYPYLLHVRGETLPPDELVLKGRSLQLTVILWMLAAILILYLK